MTEQERIRQWLLETVKLMVDQPADVTVQPVAGDAATLRLFVNHADIGKVIGKQGRTARSLRTILSAIAVTHGGRVALDIVEQS